MAQLKEDEWPADREPTTQEDAAFEREAPAPTHTDTSRNKGADERNRAADEWVINNVDPAEATD